MKKFKVKPGDLLYVDNNKTFGIVYRESAKRFWYYAIGQQGIGGPFDVEKHYLYKAIDDGTCFHQIGKTKYRRERTE
ncbi:hypothetical protein CMI47_13470 [Candidatus Pacearchaeota archaeon]|nr:hypothetical protein [Candidatus Pacearchaeota archaeon]|tara:strand:- start:145 stop:375 length:231 start_codon:yes stop_codon:yes gene_type:complete